MPKSSKFHQWLLKEESTGNLDSRGEFTLNSSKAWEKLGKFQLPFPEAWVLKIVQAAMACEGTKIIITQSREETVFKFSPPPDWSRTELEKVVFDPSFQACRAQAHLAIGIRALAMQKTRPFAIQYADGQNLAWEGRSFVEIESAKPPLFFSVTVANYEFGMSRSRFSLTNSVASKFRAQVARVLSEHCHLCHKKLSFDGRKLSGYMGDHRFGLTTHSHPLCLFKTPHCEELPNLSIHGSVKKVKASLGPHRISIPSNAYPQDINLEEFGAAGILSIFSEKVARRRSMVLDHRVRIPYLRNSEILWVVDEVVVKREFLEFCDCVGLGIVISSHDLPTDLTGLTPRENQEKEKRIKNSPRHAF